MKISTKDILTVMNILSWIVLVGLVAQAGSILISYGVSTVHPVAAKNLYMGLDLSAIRDSHFWLYTWNIVFLVVLLGLKAYTAFLVVRVTSKIKMANPFTAEVSMTIEKISYFILGIWVVSMLFNIYVKKLLKDVIPNLQENLISTEFILLAGVVFIFAQIFKRGVEIQSENELTV